GKRTEFLLQPPRPAELRATAASWAEYRQRASGRNDQAVAEQADQANGGALEGRACGAVGRTGGDGRRPRVAGLLESQLTKCQNREEHPMRSKDADSEARLSCRIWWAAI